MGHRYRSLWTNRCIFMNLPLLNMITLLRLYSYLLMKTIYIILRNSHDYEILSYFWLVYLNLFAAVYCWHFYLFSFPRSLLIENLCIYLTQNFNNTLLKFVKQIPSFAITASDIRAISEVRTAPMLLTSTESFLGWTIKIENKWQVIKKRMSETGTEIGLPYVMV